MVTFMRCVLCNSKKKGRSRCSKNHLRVGTEGGDDKREGGGMVKHGTEK